MPPLRSTSDLYSQIANKADFSVHRLRITKEDGTVIPNSDDQTLSGAGLTDTATIVVKDLGPQISWRLVFIVEYIGPLLIHPAIYYLRDYIYPLPSLTANDNPAPSELQTLTMILCVAHFLKRELETLFVHRFSSATMPASNIVRNSGYYWALAGLNMAYWIYSPDSNSQQVHDVDVSKDPALNAGLTLFFVGEALNLYTHIVLANLRPKGTTTRGIPEGFSFTWVTCPNYLWEIVAWIGIALVGKSSSTYIFLAVAVYMMGSWGWKKEKRYRKEFGDKYKKKRFAIIPGII